MWDIGWHASKYSEYLHFQMYPERWNHLAYSLAELVQHGNNISDKTKAHSKIVYQDIVCKVAFWRISII